jgi:hypothetical protein
MGGEPSWQVMLQFWEQCTVQLPSHVTVHAPTLLHVTTLPGPTCAVQLDASWQSYAQSLPQELSQFGVFPHSSVQPAPHD